MPENSTNSTTRPLVEVFTNFFRAATRPAVTIIFAAVIAQVVVQGIDVPHWFLALSSACILWWFGDRTVQHIKERGVNPDLSGLPSREKKEGS